MVCECSSVPTGTLSLFKICTAHSHGQKGKQTAIDNGAKIENEALAETTPSPRLGEAFKSYRQLALQSETREDRESGNGAGGEY